MSESWQPEESEIWQTRPSESSHPSFPFVDHSVDPFWQPLSASNPIPPPPPPPLATNAASQDDKRTEPIIGATFGMGIGVIVGAVITGVVVVALLGYLLLNKGLAFGNHSHVSTANSSSPATGGGTQGGGGGGSSSGNSGSQGGAGGSGPNVTATNGATPVPGTTPINTGTPGASMTATTVAATGTTVATNGTPLTATNTPAPLPLLTVTASAQDHKSVTVNVQTVAGASLTITVIFCDNSTANLIGSAGNGFYSNTLTNGIPKCHGNPPDTITVTAHLDGYSDKTVTTTTQGG